MPAVGRLWPSDDDDDDSDDDSDDDDYDDVDDHDDDLPLPPQLECLTTCLTPT